MTETGLTNGLVAVVFDMDGVLVDSAPHHEQAFQSIFREEGIDGFDYRQYTGRKTSDVILDVFALAGRPITAEYALQLAGKKGNRALDSMRHKYPLFPGCPEILVDLSKSYRVGLASSASPKSVDLFLEMGCNATVFRSILCSSDVKEAKPDPEIYQRSFQDLGVSPEQAAVIEDAISGIQAARDASAGAVIGIAGIHSEHELEAAGATHVLNRLTELPEYLRSRRHDIPTDHP